MGLAVRIIPTFLADGSRLVKGRQFAADRVVGHVLQKVRIEQSRQVDELIILNVSDRKWEPGAVSALTDEAFMPVTVGGGIDTLEDVRMLLNNGADKVSIGRAAIRRPQFVYEVSQAYGSQAVVASIDVDANGLIRSSGSEVLYRSGGAAEWAKELEAYGAGEILITSIPREGTMQGYDLALIGAVANAVDVPVIAHGGCKDYEDMYQAIQAGASAVAAGALFQFTDATPKEAAKYLAGKGVEVRL